LGESSIGLTKLNYPITPSNWEARKKNENSFLKKIYCDTREFTIIISVYDNFN